MDTPTTTTAVRWIECSAWELNLYGLPHRIPWPAEVDPKLADETPFDTVTMLDAIEALGPEAGPPWTTFFAAAEHFDDLAEALEDNEFPHAQQLLDKIESVHPGSIFAQFHRAHVARHDGRIEESIALYRAVAEKVPGYAFVWSNLGATLAADGRRDEAIAAFHSALRAVPKDAAALEGLAMLRAVVKVQRDPKNPADVMYVDPQTFEKMAAQQVPQLGSDPDQLQGFAEQMLREGFAPQAAIAALRKALELRPGHERTLLALAAAHRQAEQHDLARQVAVQLTEAQPEVAGAWLHLAQSHQAAGDSAAARTALEKALDLDPNLQPALALRFDLASAPTSVEIEGRLAAFGEVRDAWMPFLMASAIARDRGELAAGVRYAERAHEIAPDTEDVLLQYCALLGQARDTVDLTTHIEPRVMSGEFSRRLDWNYAQALKSAGRTQEAVAILVRAASAEGTPPEFQQAAASTIDFWNSLLAESGAQLELLKAGILARPVALRVDDGDGAVILAAGQHLPLEGKFPWRIPPDGRAETRIGLQQGQTGSALEPRDLGSFLVRDLPPVTSGAHTLQCQIAATPQGTLIFCALLGNRQHRVAWEAPMEMG